MGLASFGFLPMAGGFLLFCCFCGVGESVECGSGYEGVMMEFKQGVAGSSWRDKGEVEREVVKGVDWMGLLKTGIKKVGVGLGYFCMGLGGVEVDQVVVWFCYVNLGLDITRTIHVFF